MSTIDISLWRLPAALGLLIFPLAIMLWYRVPLVGSMLSSLIRMAVQLLFIGLYLQFVFAWNNLWINLLWFGVMTVVADFSILNHCGLNLRRFFLPLAVSLALGLAIPLLTFTGIMLRTPTLLDASLAIPIGGMILGNCMRANIIGIKGFYESIRLDEAAFQWRLAQGASLSEALFPYMGEAIKAALQPTLATIATIGLVSLPGMMTGLMLGGASPLVGVKYQFAIMMAIFSGTALTVWCCLFLTCRHSFGFGGKLDPGIFRERE